MTVRVVAAALLRTGPVGPVVLAARRRRPPRLAGGWEFPGGKVEAGETDVAALVRECREELGVEVTVGRLLGTASDGAIELVLHAGACADRPVTGDDHDELRWLGAADLGTVRWLPIDAVLLPCVTSALRGGNREGTVSRSDNDERR
jgi:8-oxo-dGTP diphosphatase